MLAAVKANLEIREVPSNELARRAGSSNLRAFRDGRRVLKTILHERRVRNAQAYAPSPQIELLALERASHESESWLPAGADRLCGRPSESSPRARDSGPGGVIT